MKFSPFPCFVVVLAIASFVSAVEAAPQPPAWDAEAFNKMEPAARVRFVREALAWREARLSNCSFDLTSEVKNLDAKTRELKKVVRAERKYTFHRLGEKYLATAISDVGIVGDVPRRFWSRWDGAVYRSFSEAGNKNKAQGNIRSTEHDLLFQVEYTQLLGWRVLGKWKAEHGVLRSLPLTLPQWIDYFVERGGDQAPQASLVQDGDSQLIQIQLKTDSKTLTFWLDPARQYMPIKFRSLMELKNYSSARDEIATDAKQVNGLWVPMRVALTVALHDDPTGIQERSYTVTRFTLGDVKEEDLLVHFPPGAGVIDVTTNVHYRLGEDGKPVAQPLGDSRTGKARTASEEELAESLEINPIKDDVSDGAVKKRLERIAQVAARNEARRRAEDVALDKPAPPFPAGATWHNSKPLTWEDLRGKILILHFFAEWCGPCKNDYPMLAGLHERGSKTLAIVGMHTAGSEPEKVAKLLEEWKITYPVCVDLAPPDRKTWGQTFNALGVQMAPHAILIDAEGRVVERGSLVDVFESASRLIRSTPNAKKGE